MRCAEVTWLPWSLFGLAAAMLAHEWARSRREDRRDVREREQKEAHRAGYQAGYMHALDGATAFRARDLNLRIGTDTLYGFGQCCRGCHRPCSVVISKRSEYWKCTVCGTINASPLPKEAGT